MEILKKYFFVFLFSLTLVYFPVLQQKFNLTDESDFIPHTFISEVAFEQPELYLLAELIGSGNGDEHSGTAWLSRLAQIRSFIVDKHKEPSGKGFLSFSQSAVTGSQTRKASVDGKSYQIFYNLLRSYLLSDRTKVANLALF